MILRSDTGRSVDGVFSMVKLVLVAIVAIFVLSLVMTLTGGYKSMSEKAAREWATAMNMRVDAVQCQNVDSDQDGYVSCSISSSAKLLMVECSPLYGGCREPKMRITR